MSLRNSIPIECFQGWFLEIIIYSILFHANLKCAWNSAGLTLANRQKLTQLLTHSSSSKGKKKIEWEKSWDVLKTEKLHTEYCCRQSRLRLQKFKNIVNLKIFGVWGTNTDIKQHLSFYLFQVQPLAKWRTACTWWLNTMLILQKPLAYGTSQCFFCGKKNWKVTSPVVPTFTCSPGGQEWLWGVDHQGPPRRPWGQNSCTEGRGHMLMIWGEWLSYVCLFQKTQRICM